jgi:hypothetical protein
MLNTNHYIKYIISNLLLYNIIIESDSHINQDYLFRLVKLYIINIIYKLIYSQIYQNTFSRINTRKHTIIINC